MCYYYYRRDWIKKSHVVSSIKNRTCFYFDNIINTLLDEKIYKKILVYDISYKTFIGVKPFRIRFKKVDGFIRIYFGTRYFVLFSLEKIMPFTKRLNMFFSMMKESKLIDTILYL